MPIRCRFWRNVVLRSGRARWTNAAIAALTAGLIFLAAGERAMATDDAGAGRSVFAPSPPPSVQRTDEDARPVDLDLTGRGPDAYPRIDGAVSLEIQNDYVVDSSEKDNEINDLTTSNDLFLAVRASPALSLQTSFVVEAVKDPKPGQDRYFEDMGTYVETLGLVYQRGAVTLFGGKFNPTFGVAWDLAPGIYGADLADDYELTERIGLGGAVTLDGGELGRHILTAQAFYLDTSILSQSWVTQRGRTREGDGGVSNTKTLESFSVTLDGVVPETVDGLRYQVGLERQRQGRTESDDEWGFAGALYGEFEVTEDIDLDPVVEWARIRNFEGERNTVNYLTAGALLSIDAWNAALSCTSRSTDPEGGSTFTDPLVQVSTGYEFENALSINVGYVYAQNEGVETHAIGVLLVYDFEFGLH